MLLAIDVGNTNTVLGLYDGERLAHHFRIATNRSATSDEVGELILSLVERQRIEVSNIKGAIVASVVPQLNRTFVEACTRSFGAAPLVVGPGIKTGMPVVTGAGLVGRVVDVSSNRSSVQLVTDPEFRVGVRLVSSQRLGTAKGQGASRALRIDTGIETGEADADIPKRAVITTSGIDDRSSFPASIPVAKVSRTGEANGGLTVEVFAEPLADLDELSFVNVLLTSPVR